MSLDAALQRLWYGPGWRSLPLWPLEALYRGAVGLRRFAYRIGLARTRRAPVPVIVVGNLTVGGTGKTPVAAWLTSALSAEGRRVGVVLRGYGGSHRGAPRVVRADDPPELVGDEALLHARGPAHVVVIGADRVAAATLAAGAGAELVISDDGLQHLALARVMEIAVADARRGFGNGHCLPAGPLRESARRLLAVDALVRSWRTEIAVEGADPRLAHRLALDARLRLGEAVNLVSGERRALAAFADRAPVAFAGVGHPEAFFAALREAGLAIEAHPLPDHAALSAERIAAAGARPILMTEKDAVKCAPGFAGPDAWYVELVLEPRATQAFFLLAEIRTRLEAAPVME